MVNASKHHAKFVRRDTIWSAGKIPLNKCFHVFKSSAFERDKLREKEYLLRLQRTEMFKKCLSLSSIAV